MGSRSEWLTIVKQRKQKREGVRTIYERRRLGDLYSTSIALCISIIVVMLYIHVKYKVKRGVEGYYGRYRPKLFRS